MSQLTPATPALMQLLQLTLLLGRFNGLLTKLSFILERHLFNKGLWAMRWFDNLIRLCSFKSLQIKPSSVLERQLLNKNLCTMRGFYTIVAM